MIAEHDWDALESVPHRQGTVVRRLAPKSAQDVFLAVQHPTGRRMLVIRVPATDADAVIRRAEDLPQTRGLHLNVTVPVNGTRDLQLILVDDDKREVFNPLVSDVAARATTASNAADALSGALDRFEHWRNLLQSIAADGLPAEIRRGLYGELLVLAEHIMPALSSADAVHAWTGPYGKSQDFQTPALALEVKTTSGRQPSSLHIADERQLDAAGTGRLVLAHLAVDERRGGTGESLNALVDRIRAALPAAPAATFGDLLARVGYLLADRHLYDEPRYTARELVFWDVAGAFPRIVETDLRPGVSDCRYRISTVGLDQYGLSSEAISSLLKGER